MDNRILLPGVSLIGELLAKEELLVDSEKDISTAFKPNRKDSEIMSELIKLDGDSKSVEYFDQHSHELTDSAYWFGLSTLWVGSANCADLETWKRLFSSNRPNRAISLMKPSELKALKKLPNKINLFRAQQPGETDWIAYSTNPAVAARFAVMKNISEISVFRTKKPNISALFLRRNEYEAIVLDKRMVKKVDVLYMGVTE
ncbi:hypothetical protein [Loigolactobacillus bifermentans]|uniref:Prophage Lp1 protein 22 n=1 Tax=Loigolactobacillus bifermentans DSM 20003 TaxID=1423726 RepID=A0A0R1H2P2_9LACO|nr:hypothetical protein [Loigolactobacillus bifermentans]KRK40828.1 prophage Lp1 protein 22 [Loigolactobacillus bifermentans DSM 20003]